MDLTAAIAPQCEIKFNGVRPGEKIHESLVSADESRYALEFDDMFVIKPMFPWWDKANWLDGKSLPEEFVYTSDRNDDWLTNDQLQEMAAAVGSGEND